MTTNPQDGPKAQQKSETLQSQLINVPATHCERAAKRGSRVIKYVLPPLLLGILSIVCYSIHIAVHEPDPQETVILGQTRIATGSPAGFRIFVRNRVSGDPIEGAEIRVRILGGSAGSIDLGRFRTDSGGSLSGKIDVPELPPGKYRLIVDASSPLGRDRIDREVEVHLPVRILLSSDKPIYQPGQTIRLRTLVAHARTGRPFMNAPVVFEVSDSKGNKVFKESRECSSFGIASADFELATELNLGRYEVRVSAGASTVQRTVEIKRYVLPK